MHVTAEAVSRRFNRRPVFADVSFTVSPGEVFGIVGRNGSGKSTLLRIVGGLLSPSSGTMRYSLNGTDVEGEKLHRHIGYVAPYLVLYEEFSAAENLALYARIRGRRLPDGAIEALLERVGLPTDRTDPIRAFSSGMKQRMRLLFAILHEPPLLLLDEPISNLDVDGMTVVYDIVEEYRRRGAVIIATNDAEDIARCDRTFRVEGHL
ncbi:MAG: ABC transporter ATP-binding protein [Bacteroidetes bacterium]|nr:ABC transporter ATP-binding protein [Bacteroidota bacterium]